MSSPHQHQHTDLIIEKAIEFGSSLAGIASLASLRSSPSYKSHCTVAWPVEARSVLVLALVHERSEPALDWWDFKGGGTEGNRRLIGISKKLKHWLYQELNIPCRPLSYQVHEGGIFLKDAAALAGLGTIGKNNLLIAGQYGPCIRLRALFLNADLQPTQPVATDPCHSCSMPCTEACPRQAFAEGSFNRARCDQEMKENERAAVHIDIAEDAGSSGRVVKYCRACELSCPMAQ